MPRFSSIAGIAAAILLVLTACSGLDYDPDKGLQVGPEASSDSQSTVSSDATTGSSGPFGLGLFGGGGTKPESGYVVGDEPSAVKAGADILNQGGSAADAATAMYFALSVTYPGSAGLGGGGLCLVTDPATGRSQAITFLARNAAGGGAYAVPGNVRGFAQLQSQYGRLPWQRDIAYAEALAASGFPISNALVTRLSAAQNVVRLDAGLAAEFLDEDGKVKPAGATVSNPDLATTLDAIRQHGADGFYSGAMAARIVTYSAQQGGAITRAELGATRADLRAPQVAGLAGQQVLLPPQSVGAGSFAGAVLAGLTGPDGALAAGAPGAVTRQAAQAALAKFGVGNLPADLGATGFAVLDRNGQAVSCAVTMNGPFGSGHTVLGTGVTLANSPATGQTGLAPAFLTPVIATADGSVTLAGAGAGGPNGTAAIADGLLELARGENITRPGNLPVPATPYDTVNAIACQNGICAVLPDVRAHGLGAAGG